MSLILSLNKLQNTWTSFLKQRHNQKEILARRGKTGALKTTMLQHPEASPKVVFSWAVYMGGLIERKSGMWLCLQRLYQRVTKISAGNPLGDGSLILR